MLNRAILDSEVSRFIKQHKNNDLPSLILKGSPFENVTIQELAIQIKGLKVAEKKFPEFYNTSNIIYPPKLNLEQTSSEITAKYKASLVKGKEGIDLTGGFGIDTYFLSQKFERFTYCELNSELAEIAKHNFETLKSATISVEHGNGLSILKTSDRKFNWVYTDPARRDDHGGKVFRFEDCEPNIPENLEMILKQTDNLMIKSSPVLDITAGLGELKFVKEIHIIAVRNEVKELLWIIDKTYSGKPVIRTINFEKKEEQKFSEFSETTDLDIRYSEPLKYLYEPNSAIMKSGLFEQLALKTDTKKLHQHSHLYTSENLKDFPGRKFEITDIEEYKPAYLKKRFKYKKANITTRNFSESVENIRKKYKIKDGGTDYIFFTTDLNDRKIMITCKKV